MKTGISFQYDGQERKFTEVGKFNLDDTLRIYVERRDFTEYQAAEWMIWFENPGKENSKLISEIYDCDVVAALPISQTNRPGYMPEKDDVCVITMRGMVPDHNYFENDRVSATEYGLEYEYLIPGSTPQKCFSNIGGRSSAGTMPFFDVTTHGVGAICAIGWTGDWKAEFTIVEDGVKIKTGLKNASFYLKPGEKIRTSSILIMEYATEDDKQNKFRRLIKKHFSHKSCTPAERDGLMAFELWGGLPSDEMIKRLTELKNHDIKFEDIWIDAGWYGQCTDCKEAFSGDWGKFTGDWEINKRVHPHNMIDVNEKIHEAGMNMMLWVEPERATTFTANVQQHPEWFLMPENKEGNAILYYGNDEAFEYIYQMLSDYIEKFHMSCYRQDFNTNLTGYFARYDEEGRRGITEIKHIMGMYRLWEQLLEKFPGLIIDNCSSGGRRIDIETIRRSIPFFRSDYQCEFNANPEVVQTHNTNISRYLPYNGCTTKVCDLYALRSSYSSSWGGAFYNAIFQSLSEEEFELARKVCEEYRSIRHYFSMDFYNHGSSVFDDTSWAIWQYHNPEDNSGIVMAFRRSNSPFSMVSIDLKGIGREKLECCDLWSGEKYVTDRKKFVIELPLKRSSIIIRYK